MALTKTSKDSRKIYNPKYIFITPFTDDKTKGAETFQCEDVIADTTSITQDENSSTPVNNELSPSPIINRVIAGNYTMATELGDVQPALLKALLGFTVSTDKTKVFAPDGYAERYAEFALVFPNSDGSTYTAAILPKVQLNARVTIDSLSSSMGRIVLAGSGYSFEVSNGSEKIITPFQFDFNYTLPTGGA